jgi:hypothetical protein
MDPKFRSCRGRHGPVQFSMMFSTGHGVPKDSQMAAKWFSKAAEQGRAEAQFTLGMMFARGMGLPKDDKLAYFWVLLASSKLSGITHHRDNLESCLTVDERLVVQAQVRNWQPKKFECVLPALRMDGRSAMQFRTRH